MTNKTDDMPQVAYLLPHNHRVELSEAKIAGHDSPVLLFGAWSNAEGIETNSVKYTRSVEITDNRLEEAEKYFLMICEGMALDPDATCNPELRVIRQALSDYVQMVECVKDFSDATQNKDLFDFLEGLKEAKMKHADIIKKCRGKDNG